MIEENNTKDPNNLPKEEKKKKIDISKYKDPTGLTVKRLERSFWLFEHKSQFQKTLIIFLLLICLSTWGYTLYYVTMYLAVGMKEDALVMRGIITSQLPGHEYTLQIAPKPLNTSRVQIFDNQEKIDIIAEVENINPWHYAYFDYCFIQGGEKLKCDQSFIHPRKSKFILNLGQNRGAGSQNITFSIEKISWRLISRHEVPDWETYKQNRINIDFEDIEFTPSKTSDLTERVSLAIVSFSAFNDSSYGYLEVPLQVFLYQGNRIVGVNTNTLRNFRPQEKVSVELYWPNISQNVSEVRIVPVINVFDKANYLYPGR